MNNKVDDLDAVSKLLDKQESEILDTAKKLEQAFKAEHKNSIPDKQKNKPKKNTALGNL